MVASPRTGKVAENASISPSLKRDIAMVCMCVISYIYSAAYDPSGSYQLLAFSALFFAYVF